MYRIKVYLDLKYAYSRAVALNWRYLETLLVVTPERGDATGIQWVEARDAAEPPAGRPQQGRIIQPNMSTVLRLRNLRSSEYKNITEH